MKKHEYVEILDAKTKKIKRRLNLTYLSKNGKSLVLNNLEHDNLIVRKVESEEELETGAL